MLVPWFSVHIFSDIFLKQKKFAASTIDLLNSFLEESLSLVGSPYVEGKFALVAIGSTSRGDRFEFSDVEFFVLYQTRSDEQAESLYRSYLFFLFSIFEFFIIRLGESECGFRIDTSEHLLAKPNIFFGTPLEIFEKHVQNIWFKSPGVLARSEIPEICQDGPELFTSLLHPFLVNSYDPGSIEVYHDFVKLLDFFLDTQSDLWTVNAVKQSSETGLLDISESHLLEKISKECPENFEILETSGKFDIVCEISLPTGN
jgi:hypothetical protein